MKIGAGLAALIFFTCPGSLCAARPFGIVNVDKDNIFLLDITNMKIDDQDRKIWMDRILSNTELFQGKYDSYSESMMEFNCKSQTYRTLSSIFFDDAGNVNWTHNEPDEWKDVPPDSIIAIAFRTACGVGEPLRVIMGDGIVELIPKLRGIMTRISGDH